MTIVFSRSPSFGKTACVGLVVTWLSVFCACQSMSIYQTERQLVQECDITPAGEFCSEGGPSAAEIISVESGEDYERVFLQNEVWILPALEDGDEFYQGVKEQSTTRAPGPCTSILRKELSVGYDGFFLNGELQIHTRVEGPPACGETPRGTRRKYILSGQATNSI